MDIKSDISLLEETLEQTFRQVPRVREKKYTSLVGDMLASCGLSVGFIPVALLTGMIIPLAEGAYSPLTGAIYVSRANPSSPEKRYTRLHELVHSYDHQRRMEISPKERENDEKFREEIRKLRPWHLVQQYPMEREEVERGIVRTCVKEGIADFVAIEADKNGERNTPNGYGYGRVRRSQIIRRQLELGASVATVGNQMIDDCYQAAKGKKLLSALASIMIAKTIKHSIKPYVIGYAYVSVVRYTHQDKTLGEVIDHIILNQPKTMQEIKDTIDQYTGKALGLTGTTYEESEQRNTDEQIIVNLASGNYSRARRRARKHIETEAGSIDLIRAEHVQSIKAVYRIAEAYEKEGRTGEARCMYREFLNLPELDDDKYSHAKLYRHIGEMYQAEGREKDAQRAFASAAKRTKNT